MRYGVRRYRLPLIVGILIGASLQSALWTIMESRQTPSAEQRLREAAQRLSIEADSVIEEYNAEKKRNLVGKYEQLLGYWRALRDPIQEARTLTILGRINLQLGLAPAASRYFELALTVAELHQDIRNQVETLTARTILRLDAGEIDAARLDASRALELSGSLADQSNRAEALLSLGEVAYRTNDYSGAIGYFEQARQLSQNPASKNSLAQSLLSLGYCHADLNQIETASQELFEALSLFRQMNHRQGAAHTLIAIGNLDARAGDNQDALDHYAEARRMVASSGDLLAEARLYNGMAFVHSELGDVPTALAFYRIALEKYRSLGNRSAESGTLRSMGRLFFDTGDLKNALNVIQQSLEVDRRLSRKRQQAYALSYIGDIHAAQGDRQSALQFFNQALALHREVQNKREEANTLTSVGYLHESSGDIDQALQFYGRSLELNRSTADQFGELTNLYRIASCKRTQQLWNDSFETIQIAVSQIEKLRTRVASYGLRTSYFATVRQHYELYVDLLMELHDRKLQAQSNVMAFEVSERSKARTLLDSIGEGRLGMIDRAAPELVERERELRVLLDSKVEQYTQFLNGGRSSNTERLSGEIQTLTAEYEELQGLLRRGNRQYAALVQPEPLKLTQVQEQLLDDNTLLLQYALGDRNSYLWAVSRGEFSSHRLPPRREIERAVTIVRELMLARAPRKGERPADYLARVRKAETQYWDSAGKLSNTLLGPVANQLGAKRLLIVGEGVLQYLPFSALPTPASGGASPTPLIVQHEIVNLPSASTLAVLRQENAFKAAPDRTLAVFADAVYGGADPRVRRSGGGAKPVLPPPEESIPTLFRTTGGGSGLDIPRLPGTRQEAAAILQFAPEDGRLAVLDFDATRTAAMNPEFSRYRILHFATHGVLNDQQPELSGIVLSLVNKEGAPQNGLLRLRDIYSMKLSAELVVLSACETALGKDVRGEGLVGMVRGFMYSGTPRVLASLWKVDDDATAELMTEFYRQHLLLGLSPAGALRAAQIAQLKKRTRQSPFYWAGFQLQGEWK